MPLALLSHILLTRAVCQKRVVIGHRRRSARNYMARISTKNIRFRPKDVICRDVSHVLRSKDLHIGTKLAVIDQIFWVWSEFDGKHAGCRYWSKSATESGLKNKGLVHEHLIPRKIVREMLLNLDDPSPEAVNDILGRFCVGVVVTKAEDTRLNQLGLNAEMPPNWDRKNLWARYEAAGIEVPMQPTKKQNKSAHPTAGNVSI